MLEDCETGQFLGDVLEAIPAKPLEESILLGAGQLVKPSLQLLDHGAVHRPHHFRSTGQRPRCKAVPQDRQRRFSVFPSRNHPSAICVAVNGAICSRVDSIILSLYILSL